VTKARSVRVISTAAFVAAGLAIATSAAAQGAVAGRVTAAGVPVAAARVEVEALGSVAASVTDRDGRFVLNGLPAGRHTLRIAAAGFRPHSVEIVAGPAAASLEIVLAPALLRHDEQLQVTASRDERRTADLPFTTTVVDAAEFARRLPRSTPEALMDAPGVLVQKTNHGSGSPYVRGLVGNQVLVLVDGVRLNNSTYRFGPNQYLATIDPGQVERVEILRGAGSVLYGSDALGGVINVITKKPPLSLNRTRLGLAATAKAMTSGMEQGGRVEVEAAGPRLAARAGFSGRNFGDIHAGGSLGVEAPSGYGELAGDASLLFRASDRSLISFSYQHLRQNDVPRFDQVAQRGFARYSFDPQVRQLGAVNLRHFPGGGAIRSVESTLSFHRSFERREIQRAGSTTQTIEEDTIGTLGFSTQANFVPWRGWTFRSGADLYGDRIASTRRDEPLAGGVSSSRRGLYPDGARARSFAGFVSGTTNRGRATVDVGARYTHFIVSASDAVFGEIELSNGAWVGNAGATYRLTSHAQVFGSVSQAFRSPNVDDVSTLGNFDSGVEVPSPNLVPERSVSVEAGLRLQAGPVAMTASGFRTNLRDLIDRVRSTFQGSDFYEGQPVFQKANVQRAYVYGAEIEADWRATGRLTIFGHASYAFGHQPTLDQPMRRIPPLNGLLAARWTTGADGLWIEGRVRAASAQTRLSAGDLSDHRINPAGTPGWIVASIGAGRPLGSKVEIVGAIENLFNEAYRIHGSGIDGVGRSAWVGLRVKV
jgi:outer membrane receptor protein involved in Fe transport